MSIVSQMREKWNLWMVGRNGYDTLNMGVLFLCLVVSVVRLVVPFPLLDMLGTCLFLFCLYRFHSKELFQRRLENRYFQRKIQRVTLKWRDVQKVCRDREHIYFHCPHCKQQLRVPRGKGQIKVTCSSCYHIFYKKS